MQWKDNLIREVGAVKISKIAPEVISASSYSYISLNFYELVKNMVTWKKLPLPQPLLNC
jgi:hypothetical protein